MNRPLKWCSQPDSWHLAQSRSWFCDFGRKLENLSVSVVTQWCSAMDGRTRQHRVMDDSLLPFTSLRENLTQTHLDFSYFRTTEPKLLRLCARCHSQTYETPFRWATHASTNHNLPGNSLTSSDCKKSRNETVPALPADHPSTITAHKNMPPIFNLLLIDQPLTAPLIPST